MQWCVELRYLIDPATQAIPQTTTTARPLQTFPGHFLKKYEKYLRRDGGHSTGSAANASYRKSNNELLTDSEHNVDNKYAMRGVGGETKRVNYEKLWPKSKNLRKKQVKPTEAPAKGLTALASFPVSGCSTEFYLRAPAIKFSCLFVSFPPDFFN